MNRLIIALTLASFWACTSKQKEVKTENQPDDPIELATAHYKNMMSTLGEGEFPRSFEKGKFTTSNSEWWCSGFYPGTLLYLYEINGDTVLLNEANRMLGLLEKEQYNTGTHDLGFMMFCSFGNVNRLESKPEYKEILINSAKSLSSRFSPEIGCIRSWNSGDDDYIVIIDNMMNLELLFWATQETGDSTYYDIAVTHANTTMANHFREDNSSYHVLNYATDGSGVQEKKTAQGLSDSSAWARGQAWGLYGYTVMFRATGDSVYLDQANKIAQFVMNHPNLPADKIPVWDFDTAHDAPRDASAAAIMSSSLLELETYTPGRGYANLANEMLNSLSSNYLADLGANGNFLIEHCVGHLPANSEVDVPLTYADYYYIEAMMRAGRTK